MIENKSYKKGYSNSSGQALVEYVLTLITVVGIFIIMNQMVLRGIGNLWTEMAKKVAAPCPNCTPPSEIQ